MDYVSISVIRMVSFSLKQEKSKKKRSLSIPQHNCDTLLDFKKEAEDARKCSMEWIICQYAYKIIHINREINSKKKSKYVHVYYYKYIL